MVVMVEWQLINVAISTDKCCSGCKLTNSIKLPNNNYLRRLNVRVWGIMAIRMFMGWHMFPFMCFYQHKNTLPRVFILQLVNITYYVFESKNTISRDVVSRLIKFHV